MAVPDLGGKLFSYKIKYNEKEGITSPDPAQFPGKEVAAKYNGNIAEVDWRSVESIGSNPSTTPKRYGYVYDRLNRLTAGFYQTPNNAGLGENTESLTYDLNGNITKLFRTSVLEYGSTTPTKIDDLEYIYDAQNKSNKLITLNDNSYNPTGYEGGGMEIKYDFNGNMTEMPDKGINKIDYNYLNLPNKVNYSKSGNESVIINTKYDAGGEKLQKENTTTTFGINGYTTSRRITDYLGGFQYLVTITATPPPSGGGSESMMANSETGRALERQAYSIDNDSSFTLNTLTLKNKDLQFFPTAEGFYDYKKDQYIYQYKDHLGNVRVSFGRNTSGNLELVDVNDYYPFGMNHLKSGASFFGVSSYKNYKYNGKELQETGMYDYGARMYMADIGRWGVVDPLAETSRRWSTYTYAYNNPIRFVDPDGMQNEDKIKIFNDGKIERTKDNNNYDTVTNENESKSIRIARTNITEKNPTGDSQIGEAITTNVETPGHDGLSGGTQFTYMQIQDYDVATQVFEFAADNTKVEFGQDTLNFTDGYSTNIVSTNHSENESSSAVNAIGYINVSQPGSVFRHFINKATREERVHSHPGGPELEVGPSGFDAYRSLKTGEVTVTPSTNRGDRASYDSSIKNVYQYTPGYGYFKYNNNSAIYNGSKKK